MLRSMLRSTLIALGMLALGAVAANPQPAVRIVTQNVCGSAVSSCVLKSSPGNLFTVYAECTAACWLMVFNAVSAPSNGSTTAGPGNTSGNMVECFDIAAAGSKSVSYLPYASPYSVGITAVISSTACATLTLATTGFISGSVQ